MNGWIHKTERLPTRADSDEHGLVWIDDGLQVTTCPWSHVPARNVEWWQPRPARNKPGRARRMG